MPYPRKLTDKEIDYLASKPKVKRIAVENFLIFNDGNDPSLRYQLQKETELHKWNAPTVKAISQGVEAMRFGIPIKIPKPRPFKGKSILEEWKKGTNKVVNYPLLHIKWYSPKQKKENVLHFNSRKDIVEFLETGKYNSPKKSRSTSYEGEPHWYH